MNLREIAEKHKAKFVTYINEEGKKYLYIKGLSISAGVNIPKKIPKTASLYIEDKLVEEA